MTNNSIDFDFDDEATGPKALREFAKAQKKQNEELQKELTQIRTEARQRAVRDAVTSKGLPEKVAALVPQDADPDEWITNYGDLFGLQAQAQQEQVQQEQVQQTAQQVVQPDQAELAAQFAQLQQMAAMGTGLQSAGQINPQINALEKAAAENGPQGIIDLMRSFNATA